MKGHEYVCTHVLKSTAVKKEAGHFWSRRESVGEDARAGQPATVYNTRNIEKVKREIKKDCRKTIRDVAASTDIAEFGDEEGVLEAGFESLEAGTEERTSLHCRNIVVVVEWVLYGKNVDTAFYIEKLQKLRICIRKKKQELWAEPVRAPPGQCPQPLSWFNAKVPGKE